MRNKDRKITIPIILMMLLALGVYTFGMVAKTRAIGLIESFGGKVDSVTYCSCSLSSKITLEGSIIDSYMKSFVTRVYDYGNISSGHWVLGSAVGIPVPCLQLQATPPFCVPQGLAKPIIMIGTN